MTDVAIRVQHLSKQFQIGAKQEKYRMLRDALVDLATATLRSVGSILGRNGSESADGSTVWALRDVSFEVMRGEVLGIIGRNGAGKSTLLKVLSRITEPTEGHAEIHGRVASLLEVGTGFHPELTGRENIYLNGAILGMRRVEIGRKFDEMVAFAEVERFIDTPVKHYSSGMYLRLAFAVAAHLEPEILLVDEVLAVGDAEFQRKCLGKMGDVASQGRTVLLVSHNMAAVSNLCREALQVEHGQIVARGAVHDVIGQYVRSSVNRQHTGDLRSIARSGRGGIRLSEVRVLGNGGQKGGLICGSRATIALRYEAEAELATETVSVQMRFIDSSGATAATLWNKLVSSECRLIGTDGWFLFTLPSVPFLPGRYTVRLWVKSVRGREDSIEDAGYLDVAAGDFFGTGRQPVPDIGSVLVPHSFRVADHLPNSVR